MKKKKEQTFNLLPEEARENEIKSRSNRRLFLAFVALDLFLLFYIVYSLIMLFTHL